MHQQKLTSEDYGKELILDLKNCDTSKFTREELDYYFERLCDQIDMKRDELYFWDDLETPEEEMQTDAHTKGTSAVQFILTSNITIHTLDELKRIYVNIFSCKDYNTKIAKDFTKTFFSGEITNEHVIKRR